MVTSIIGAIGKVLSAGVKIITGIAKGVFKAGTAIKTVTSSAAAGLAKAGAPTLVVHAVSNIPKVLATGIIVGKSIANSKLQASGGQKLLNKAVVQPLSDVALLSLI